MGLPHTELIAMAGTDVHSLVGLFTRADHEDKVHLRDLCIPNLQHLMSCTRAWATHLLLELSGRTDIGSGLEPGFKKLLTNRFCVLVGLKTCEGESLLLAVIPWGWLGQRELARETAREATCHRMTKHKG